MQQAIVFGYKQQDAISPCLQQVLFELGESFDLAGGGWESLFLGRKENKHTTTDVCAIPPHSDPTGILGL